MKKYGFLFGAGAELAYNLPSGGKFALDIFRHDTTASKEEFKRMRDEVDSTTSYAGDWLPQDYRTRNIGTFGKTVFENIISSTVEHRRNNIIECVNAFDDVATRVLSKMDDDVNGAFRNLLNREVRNIKLSQDISYNDYFKKGNSLFESNYFSSLLLVYKELTNDSAKPFIGKILLSIMQLQLGALSEDLTRNINDNLFQKKDDGIDLFDDFGELIQINYKSAGVSGLELLVEKHEISNNSDVAIIQQFAQGIIEDIYASVLDYKTLIDTNWHSLYCPKSDWMKFCRISIFLLTVREYISDIGKKAQRDNPDGYYNMLKDSLSDGAFEISGIGTTNYNSLITDILGLNDIIFLNGSISVWYDPYLNKIGKREELSKDEGHIVVPLIFTQSGTKPMTSISMSEKYVDLYRAWRKADAVVSVGFGFNADDEHINGILRTLVNDDNKDLYIVTPGKKDKSEEIAMQKAKALKISDASRIHIIAVDEKGYVDGKQWTKVLGE
ncbi:hypothetical protein QYZ88_015870 [Lachnospiraceae bacterium C1.1]|nr:hypothetical protein [Lachnospiraceae bacterium C1.1]